MAKEMETHPNSTSFENRNDKENELVRHMTMMLENVQPPEDSIVRELCIYRAPYKIRHTNPEAYTPHVVSIGPIHSPLRDGDSRLKPMEELKLKYLKSFLKRTQLSVSDCFSKLKRWEVTMRRCYAEPVELNSDDFLKMVMIDACFIIELFLRFYSYEDWIERDPILLNQFTKKDVVHDLILLENQLPFFVLEGIYILSVASQSTTDFPSFLNLTFIYFKKYNRQSMKPENVGNVQHFVDLLRTFLLPSSLDHRLPIDRDVDTIEHLYSASQLLEAGLIFKGRPSKCLLDLKFHVSGVLKMPRFRISSTTEIFMRNIVVFEQCHYPSSPYIAEYIKILDFLINRGKDVETLVKKKIILNLLEDDEAVATMVNSLSSITSLSSIDCELGNLCRQLNGFYENHCNKYKAIFKHEYFNTPWKIASTIAAILLLLLTFIQTVCSIVSLFRD